MKNRVILILASIFSALLLASCGEGKIDISDAKYEPKLVISGYIYPGKNVEKISIMRNIPLNSNVDYSSVILKDADVKVIEVSSGNVFKLVFDDLSMAFKYNGTELKIEPGKSYRLEVAASVDGKMLKATSTTTVPLNGFKVLEKDLGIVPYREKDANGNLKKMNFNFKPSSNASYYGISIVPLENDYSHFIKDNAYFKIEDSADVIKNLDNYRYQYDWVQNVNSSADKINVEIEWARIWFYSKYRVIVYAGDQNFRNFSTSNQELQEMDGNFHTPIIDIQGDGIGVFASAIADTLTFTVK